MPALKITHSFLITFCHLVLSSGSPTSPDVTMAKNDAEKGAIAKEEKSQSDEGHKTHWSYEGETGPEHWGDIDPDYARCANGKEQSPIRLKLYTL